MINYDLPPIIPSVSKFEPTDAAAQHNMAVIISHGSVKVALESETNSPLAYGSKFRPTQALDKLMHRHPLWNKTKYILQHGTIFPLRPVNEKIREQDLRHSLTYKSHNSAHENSSLA